MKPYQTVIDIIRDLAKQNPEQTSDDAYFDYEAKKPECIVGHALAILGGVPTRLEGDIFSVLNPEGETLVKGYQSASVVNWASLGITPPSAREADWSDSVQGRQDSGAVWGKAVQGADDALPLA